jgi:hypothetical protein
MDESLIDRIERLEQSVHFWRTCTVLLAAVLLSLSTFGTVFVLMHQQRLLAMEAVQQERAAAMAAQMQAERALKEAKDRKD